MDVAAVDDDLDGRLRPLGLSGTAIAQRDDVAGTIRSREKLEEQEAPVMRGGLGAEHRLPVGRAKLRQTRGM